MRYSPKYMAAARRRRGPPLDKQAFRAYQQMLQACCGLVPAAEVQASPDPPISTFAREMLDAARDWDLALLHHIWTGEPMVKPDPLLVTRHLP